MSINTLIQQFKNQVTDLSNIVQQQTGLITHLHTINLTNENNIKSLRNELQTLKKGIAINNFILKTKMYELSNNRGLLDSIDEYNNDPINIDELFKSMNDLEMFSPFSVPLQVFKVTKNFQSYYNKLSQKLYKYTFDEWVLTITDEDWSDERFNHMNLTDIQLRDLIIDQRLIIPYLAKIYSSECKLNIDKVIEQMISDGRSRTRKCIIFNKKGYLDMSQQYKSEFMHLS